MIEKSNQLAVYRDWSSPDGHARTLREQYAYFLPRPQKQRPPSCRSRTVQRGDNRMRETNPRIRENFDKQETIRGLAVASRPDPKRADNWRETIESIVVAFVLAFLFRT